MKLVRGRFASDMDVDIVALEGDRKAPCPDTAVDQELSGPDVEFPAMPCASDQLPRTLIYEFRLVCLPGCPT